MMEGKAKKIILIISKDSVLFRHKINEIAVVGCYPSTAAGKKKSTNATGRDIITTISRKGTFAMSFNYTKI